MLRDSVTDWFKYPHALQLGASFQTHAQSIRFALLGEHPDGSPATPPDGVTSDSPEAQQQFIESMYSGELQFFTKACVTDSSVGGNDAINPYWQFCENDDIIHPLNSMDAGRGYKGMGRVYFEKYEVNQQILWMTMGIPKYIGLTDFYLESIIEGLAGVMNTGGSANFGTLSSFLVKGVVLAIKLPFLPIYALQKILNIMQDIPVVKYYGFRNAMLQYFRTVNTILAELSAGMGLIPMPIGDVKTGGVNEAGLQQLYDAVGTPEVLRNGPDIFAIMDKRAAIINNRAVKTTDDLLKEMQKREGSRNWFEDWAEAFTGSMLGGSDFIGFRIERTLDSSESVSNQTGPSALAEKLNQRVAEKREANFNKGNGWIAMGKNIADLVGKIKATFNPEAQGDLKGLGDLALDVVTGAGNYDLPEVWQNSTFQRSYNFTMMLRARYGDPVSIFQSEYIPLACIMAAAFPRALGRNTFTSPFILRAYCKGMFAVPLGMIDSLSIRRGAPEFGWNYQQLPLQLEISFTIKDLSPSFFLAIADISLWNVLSRNDNMQEYLATLSGIGLQERYFFSANLKRRFAAWWQCFKTTKLSPLYWGNAMGFSSVPRAIAAFIPTDRVSFK